VPLTAHGLPIAPGTYWARRSRPLSRRSLKDAALTEILAGIYEPDEHGRRPPQCLYGSLKMWGHLNRQGITVAKCTVDAFVIDAFAGLIPGWECSPSQETAFVERAIRQAAACRARQGHPIGGPAAHHSDAGSPSTPRSVSPRPCCWPG